MVRVRSGVFLAFAALLPTGAALSAKAADFYVSPTGTTSTAAGTGTITNPWSLQTALSQPATVRPGDTIWLRGGTYRGKYVTYLTGTSTAPIVVRVYPGEWAKIDSGSGNPSALDILQVNGAYAWYWGFEIMSSDPRRQSTQDGSWPADITRGGCASTNTGQGVGVKFINLVCHDAAGGISPWKDSSDAEVYGSLIYYNGWDGATDGGHGHGLYVQNITGSKFLTDNIVFQNFSHGIHAYTETSYIDNIQAEGNTVFLNGEIASAGSGRNLLIGGARVAQNPILRNNLLYFWAGGPQSSLNLGYSAGCSNPVVTDNYIADNSYFINCSGGLRTGNTFAGKIVGFTPSQYPSNTYFVPPARPTGAKVFVRPNRYEAGRGHIAVVNWGLASAVDVDVSSILTVGSSYEVRNAQNFFGPTVLSGVYAGGTLSLPMTGLPPAAPVGGTPQPATGPEFNAFVVKTVTASPGPTPTPTPMPTPTPTPTPRVGTTFNTVSPCRLVDTRNPAGPLGGPALQSNATRRFTVTSSCGIPTSAVAVAANITVVPGGSGFMTFYPGNGVLPATSNVSFSGKKVRSNVAILYLATDGTGGVNVFNSSASSNDFILDVNGYFR